MIELITDEQRAELKTRALVMLEQNNHEGLVILIEEFNHLDFELPTQFDRENALFYAADSGHLEVVKYLIANGADIHAEDDNALACASESGHLEVVKYLVEAGADVCAWSSLALRCAASEGRFEVVKYLVEHGADIHAEDWGDTALKSAVDNNHLEIARYLESIDFNMMV